MITIKEIGRRIQIERDYISSLGKNWLSPQEQKVLQKRMGGKLSNEMRSRYEVSMFNKDRPTKYTVYVNLKDRVVTTWTGEVLGKIIHAGDVYRSAFGDKRINIRVRMNNGQVYSGTYFTSAGDYAHIKRVKG